MVCFPVIRMCSQLTRRQFSKMPFKKGIEFFRVALQFRGRKTAEGSCYLQLVKNGEVPPRGGQWMLSDYWEI